MNKTQLTLEKIKFQTDKAKIMKDIAKANKANPVDEAELARLAEELSATLEALDFIREQLRNPVEEKPTTTETSDDGAESKEEKFRKMWEPICLAIMNDSDYHYIQRHHCYYKRAKNGELEDVMPGSLSIAHPCLQSRAVHTLFDNLMVSQGRVHHEINYSFRKLPNDVLNLMKISPLQPIAPDATFKKEYFDLLVETACGDYKENIEHAEKWFTWKYMHPSDYSLPAIVLFRSGGAGKNLLFEMINRIIWGDEHICKVEGEDFFDKFNDDQLGTAIVFIDEMDFDKQNINKLKARVQQANWKVNGKFKRRWEVDTTMGFVLATNDARGGVRLSRDNVDRRWSIMKCKASLVDRFNQRYFSGNLTPQEATTEWEKIAEGILKDSRQVAMWLYTLIEKWGKEEARPTALHGIDYDEVCMLQKNTMHDVFERVFTPEFTHISLETLFAVSGVIHKDLHQGTYRQSSGALLAHMLEEISKAKLPIKYNPKKAYFTIDGKGYSKGWFYHESLEGTTLKDNTGEWITAMHAASTSLRVDINRQMMMEMA